MDQLYEHARPLYDEGLNDLQIAAKFGVSKQRVQDWRKSLGLPTNCATGSEDWYACLQNVDRDAMLMRLHENGLTDRQAAAMMRVSVSAAKCRRLRLGLPCNSELKAAI